jgi:hypothetical protein
MYMLEDGTHRQIYYDDPRPGLKEVGVKQGTLLFDGVVDGTALSGTAFVFAKECDPLSFAVTGKLTGDGKRITLNGKAPRIGMRRVAGVGWADCRALPSLYDCMVATCRTYMRLGKITNELTNRFLHSRGLIVGPTQNTGRVGSSSREAKAQQEWIVRLLQEHIYQTDLIRPDWLLCHEHRVQTAMRNCTSPDRANGRRYGSARYKQEEQANGSRGPG